MEQSDRLVYCPLSIYRLPPYLHQKYFLNFLLFLTFFWLSPFICVTLYILPTFLSHSLPMCVFLCTDRSVSAHIHPSLSLSVSHFFSSSSSLFLLLNISHVHPCLSVSHFFFSSLCLSLNSDKCFPGSSQKKFSREWMQHMRAWSSGITLIKYRIMIEKKLKKDAVRGCQLCWIDRWFKLSPDTQTDG